MNAGRRLTIVVAAACLGSLPSLVARAQDPETSVEQVFLDDVWPAPQGTQTPPLVELYVRVMEGNQDPVDGLEASDFRIVIDGEAVDPATVQSPRSLIELDRGVAGVIALDISMAMIGEPLTKAIEAAREFLETVDPRSRIAIVVFASKVRVIAPFDADADQVRAALDALEVDTTAEHGMLYDGLNASIDLIRETSDLPRRAFVVAFSDGTDAGSLTTHNQLVEAAEGTETAPPILVDAVGYGSSTASGFATLERIAAATGGISVRAVSTIHFAPLFRVIWHRMNDGYVIRFPADLDGEHHDIEVEVAGHRASRGARYPDLRPSALPSWDHPGVLTAAGLLVVGGGLWLLTRRRSGHVLVFEEPLPNGREFALSRECTSIGFMPDNDIVVPNDTVSKHHVQIRKKGSKLEIEDLESLNGTYLNGTRIRKSSLEPGDRIRIADIEMVYRR